MKKSVIEDPGQRALENSEVAPGILIRVMDPVRTSTPSSVLARRFTRERVLDGWRTSRGISERRGGEKLMRVENMTDREIVAACAVDFRRKAQEAYDAPYQSTGMTRYDNAYHKYEALADALDRDVQKADTRQAAASPQIRVDYAGIGGKQGEAALRAGRCAAGAGERGYCGRTTVRL